MSSLTDVIWMKYNLLNKTSTYDLGDGGMEWFFFFFNYVLKWVRAQRGFEYVKNGVDNSHFLRLSNYLGEGQEGWFFFLFVSRVSGVQKERSVLNFLNFSILNWWVSGFELRFLCIYSFWSWVDDGGLHALFLGLLNQCKMGLGWVFFFLFFSRWMIDEAYSFEGFWV
jgi:hypothetical protein